MTSGRRIKLPNIVRSTNTTFACHIREGPIDLGALADHSIPTVCIAQLLVDYFFVTFASASSNFNGQDDVEYNEVIIKVPVVVDDRQFIFPPRTYVDNELSLVRGYQLGFNKYVAPVNAGAEGCAAFDGAGLEIKAEAQPKEPIESTAELSAAAGAFVLSDSGTPVELILSNHCLCFDSGWVRASGSGVILGHPFYVTAAKNTVDRFMLHGTDKLR